MPGNNNGGIFTVGKDIRKLASSPLQPPQLPFTLASFKSLFDDALDSFEFSAWNSMAVMTGTVTFAASLSLSTFLQHKLLKVSTSTPAPIPSMLGLGAVTTAAFVSHIASVKAHEIAVLSNVATGVSGGGGATAADAPDHSSFVHTVFTMPSIDLNIFHEDTRKRKENLMHIIRVCVVGVLAYKGLGGRLWSISPSSLTHLGSFARTSFSLPATVQYANKSQRQSIEKLGRMFGCHTCGSRQWFSASDAKGVNFIADHMPPLAVVEQMNNRWYRKLFGIKVRQRFYPQCVTCSNKQGGILSSATREMRSSSSSLLLSLKKQSSGAGKAKINLSTAGGGSNAHIHGLRLRLEHLAGGIVAAATVCGADTLDIVAKGNRSRFEAWQNVLEEVVVEACEFVRNFVS